MLIYTADHDEKRVGFDRSYRRLRIWQKGIEWWHVELMVWVRGFGCFYITGTLQEGFWFWVSLPDSLNTRGLFDFVQA